MGCISSKPKDEAYKPNDSATDGGFKSDGATGVNRPKTAPPPPPPQKPTPKSTRKCHDKA